MVRLSLILFLVTSCGSVPGNIGFHEDQKPYKGTNSYKRDYVRPYWQCVQFNRNVDCNVE